MPRPKRRVTRPLKFALALSCGLLFTLAVSARGAEPDPARVMFFGTFHFKDAGLDVVKVEDVDIFSEENLAYLEGLTTRLAGFKPTVVLLEYNPDNEQEMNERYRAYLDGAFELPANEVYQLGFRIAKKAGLDRVHSFDHRDVHWQAQPLFDYAKAHDSPELEVMNQAIDRRLEAEDPRPYLEANFAR